MSVAVGKARPLRWLVAAPFSARPSGRVTAASGERFQNVMAKLGPEATVEIPDGLGSAATRSVTLGFARPRDFRLTEVVARVDALRSLGEIADALTRSSDLDAALAKLRATIGDGDLVRAIESFRDEDSQAPSPAQSPEQTQATASETAPTDAAPTQSSDASGGSALDTIFSKAAVSAPTQSKDVDAAARSSIDAFIGAVRSTGAASPRSTTPRSAKSLARDAAELIRRAVDSAALDLLASPAIATLEGSWRGLRMVVSASPGADDLALDLLDVDAEALTAGIEAALAVPAMDRPDAVFVAMPVGSPERLAAVAALAASHAVPIVVDVPEAMTGGRLEEGVEPAASPDTWTELRANPASAWLCAASNAVVLANEDVGGTQRIVFGSPVWGVASMLSASVGQTGAPGQIFGRAGALVSPASMRLSDDPNSPTIATERLASIEQQRTLAERGVLVLGSERGSDRLRLAAAPMVHDDASEMGLPGRILAGRATRLTRSIRDELPPQATEQEVASRLADAATNFLPRTPAGAVALNVRTDAEGRLEVNASIGAALAGASFEFSSDL